MEKPLLDLRTDNPGAPVIIDGKRYMLSHPDSLSLSTSMRSKRIGERLIELSRVESLTADQEAEVGSLLDQFCRGVLDAPDVVHARLSDNQRVIIMTTFKDLRSRQLSEIRHLVTRRTKKR